MFNQFWHKITNRGVTPGLDFNIRNKIRTFNSSIFVVGCLYLAYTLICLVQKQYLASALCFFSYVCTASCLYLMTIRKYLWAYHITAVNGILYLCIFSLLFGENTLTHVYLLFIPVAALVLFDDFRTCLFYFLFAIGTIILTKTLFLYVEPYYPVEPITKILGFMNIGMTGALLYIAVRMFKYENLIYSKEINEQRDVIEEKNKDILSSIHYAKRIQTALLASGTLLSKNLPEHFVLYKPKDIVSGDFYWGEQLENRFLLCTGDCTGHGVPGAFMSLLGVSFLNEIVIEKKIVRPDLIFNQLRDDIIKVLNPAGTLAEGKDGMDAVLCSFDFNTLTLEFACANNPLWIIRDKQLIEFKADKQPIGMYEGERKKFTLQTTQLQKGDLICSLTDGYADQFGGEKGKKFKYKQLQDTLINISEKPMKEQQAALDKTITDWKGDLDQVDDILIIGVKI